MTLIGKIFTVFIFVMSLMFMTLSLMVIATHKNWKDEAGELQAAIIQRDLTIESLGRERTDLESQLAYERVARKASLASLQSKLIDLQQNLSAKEVELADKTALSVKVAAELERAQATLTEVSNEVQTTRADLQVTMQDRDAQLAKVTELTTTLHNSEQDLRIVNERNSSLNDIRAKMARVLEINGIKWENPTGDPPPGMVAMVSQVNGDGLIRFSIGMDDGIKKGQILKVIDKAQKRFLGEVEVISTEPNVAIGQFTPRDRATKVTQGDYVSTELR